ncbi:MAG: hypothetical protein DHS20C10_10450 [marine bacterium B5-7]|nr:MAG: hypothetical protein DHS20C10_10450 [marine bacterium B5-7]
MDKYQCLDVGCGTKKQMGALGIDQFPLLGVDVACDLNITWPLAGHSFDEVVFNHSINHCKELLHILTEVQRVSRDGARIKILAPHFSSDNIFTDPTVRFFIGYRTFDYYCHNTSSLYHYYADMRFQLVRRWIHLYKRNTKSRLEKLINKLIYPLEFLINHFPRAYEKFFCFILRANEIYIELQKVD